MNDTVPGATVAARPAACANCGAPFEPERRRFCPECGQETQLRAPTFGEFLQQFGGAYFATEGALWRTLKLLLFKPGELTRQYLAGRRKHYVLPLRLYLTISLATLLIVRLAGSVEMNVQPEPSKGIAKAANSMSLHIGGGQAGLRDGVFYCQNLPAWLCQRIQRRIDIDPKALAMSGVEWLILISVLGVPVYTLLAMKRVYGDRLAPRLLRAGAVSLLYGVVLTAAIAAVGLFTLVF